jgi:hypothetical protein
MPSGKPVAAIAQPDIAAAYLPLRGRIDFGLAPAASAAMAIAPGIAVTNAHNANLIDPKLVIGRVGDYDLLYFRTGRTNPPTSGEPVIGAAVTAYGEDTDGRLRLAHGIVREIHPCDGCGPAPAYFTFVGDAGPGFSGGPVVDASGRLVGIMFGYKDEGPEREIYAYDMARVRAELATLKGASALK